MIVHVSQPSTYSTELISTERQLMPILIMNMICLSLRTILDILYVIKISYSKFPFQGCENFLVSCNKLEIGDIYLRCSSVLSWHTSSKSKAAMSLVLQLPIVLRIQFSHYSTSIISMHKCSSSLVSLYRHVHIYVLCCIVAILVVLL